MMTLESTSESCTEANLPGGSAATGGVAPAAVLTIPCREIDADLWFAENPVHLEQAKALCADCPLQSACLSAALERAEPWGVWGGEIFDQGVIIARKRPRGRPRKNPVAA